MPDWQKTAEPAHAVKNADKKKQKKRLITNKVNYHNNNIEIY